MNITLIYTRLIMGGLGYAPQLYRVGRKYFTVRGDTDADNYRKLAGMDFPQKQDGHSLWMKHYQDNEISAGEFLKIIGR